MNQFHLAALLLVTALLAARTPCGAAEDHPAPTPNLSTAASPGQHPPTSAPAQAGFHPRLLQLRLDSTSVPAGGSLGVTYWWLNVGDRPADTEDRVFVHVRRVGEAEDAPDGVRLGADHDPPVGTQRWKPGRVVHYFSAVPIPDNTPPGDYVLLLGLFDPEAGGRQDLELPIPPGENDRRYLVAQFHVLPRTAQAAGQPETHTFFPVPSALAAPAAPATAKTVIVGKGPLTLVLDADSPRPLAWRLNGSELGGDPEGDEPDIRILGTNLALPSPAAVAGPTIQVEPPRMGEQGGRDNRPHLADNPPFHTTWTGNGDVGRRSYHARISDGTRPCVDLDLTFRVTGDSAEIALENVVEHDGYQLLSVRVGHLVSAAGGARMAIPSASGALVDPEHTIPTEQTYPMDWFHPVLAGVLHNRRLVCALDVPGVDDRLTAAVGEGWAALGASFEHRAPTKPPVPSLLLSDRSVARLRFASPKGQEPDWMDGASLLRDRVTARPPKLYDHAVIYKIFCDSPGANNFTTFDQALNLVRRMGNLVDGAPQIAYLVGWQHHGHDTGYPDVFTVNARLGGIERLVADMKKAADYNAVLSFHDNYDDAYESSPAWNPDFIARDTSANLMKGGVWAGGQSYIHSFYKYGTGPAQDRIRRTLAMYPIRSSYHIDVLSAVPLRRDYNPQSPTSGAKSVEGKIAIVKEFNKYGIDVTSEGFTAPFVGVIGHAWNLIRGRSIDFAGQQRIPFVPFVFHGRATWGGAQPTTEDIPDALLYGATFSADFSKTTPQSTLTADYYLLAVPWLTLRDREMTSYQAHGTIRHVDYGPKTSVEVDDSGPHYRVVVDGRPISVDFTCFAPGWRRGSWIAYSRAGGLLDYPAPKGWTNPSKLKAVELTQEGPGSSVPVQLEAGHIKLDTKPGTPYRVTYGP